MLHRSRLSAVVAGLFLSAPLQAASSDTVTAQDPRDAVNALPGWVNELYHAIPPGEQDTFENRFMKYYNRGAATHDLEHFLTKSCARYLFHDDPGKCATTPTTAAAQDTPTGASIPDALNAIGSAVTETTRRKKKTGSSDGPTPSPQTGKDLHSGTGWTSKTEQTEDPPSFVDRVIAKAHEGDPRLDAYFAEKDYAAGDYARALEKGAAAISAGVADPRTLATYAGANYQLGNYAEARKAAEAALKLQPDNAAAFSIMQLSQGRAPKAALPPAMDRWAGTDAGKPPAVAGFPGEASSREAASMRPSSSQLSAALTRASAASLQDRDYGRALGQAAQAIEADPSNAQAYVYRSMAYSRLGRYKEAEKDAAAALRLAPGNPASLISRALARNRLGEHAGAWEDAASAVERAPQNPFAHLMKAYAAAGLGRKSEMLSAAGQAAALSPAFSDLRDRLSQAAGMEDCLLLFAGEFNSPNQPSAAPPSGAPPGWPPAWLWAVLGGAALVAIGLVRRAAVPTTRRPAAAAPAPTPKPGGAFSTGYDIVRCIGAGGMGEVFEARDLGLDRRVAIKKMRDEIRRDPRERERFLAEARLVAKLKHPNIVEIYAIVEDDDDAYLIFEFVEGLTLHQVLAQRGRLPFEEARGVLVAACAAVDFAHAHGVIHRDLKPANIMLEDAGAVRVMDFGVARQSAEALSRAAMTGTVVGTPPYMAPEQELGAVQRESDVYALAICLYELCCGELPFIGTGGAMLLAKREGKFLPLAQRPGVEVPPGLDAVLSRALAPDPSDRYRTAASLAAALKSVAPA